MDQEEKREGRITWDEYRSWEDDLRWEIIDGKAFAMPVRQTSDHRSVCAELHLAIAPFFRGRSRRVFFAPIDVKLSEQDIVKPDLVVCGHSQVRSTYIEGAPLLVVEVLSPATEAHDRATKLPLYARFGVKEFWLVNPSPAYAQVLLLQGDSYRVQGTYDRGETLQSPSLPDLSVDLNTIFRAHNAVEGAPPG